MNIIDHINKTSAEKSEAEKQMDKPTEDMIAYTNHAMMLGDLQYRLVQTQREISKITNKIDQLVAKNEKSNSTKHN